MAINNNIYDGLAKDGKVKVNLSTSTFGDDKVFYGKVVKNLITASNFYKELQDELPEISEGIIFAVCNAVQKRTLKLLKKAYAVDCLSLGIFRIATSGTTDSTTGTIPLTVKFTPSELVKEAIRGIQINEVSVSKPKIIIDKIIDISTGLDNGILTPNNSVEILGTGLKVLGNDSSIWFCEADENGNYSNDENTWIKVQRIHYNCQKKLQIILPNSLTSGTKYVIVIKTRSSSSGSTEIKILRTVISAIIKIS